VAILRRPGGMPAVVALALTLTVLAPPVDALADRLLSVHMVQHLVLGLWAPIAAAVAVVSAWPLADRLGAGYAWLTAATALHVGAFWLWHVPAAYDAAVRTLPLHVLEHLVLLGTGVLFWTAVLARSRTRPWRWGTAGALAALFVAGLGTGVLAALLTLASHPFYDVHLQTTARYGISALEDQQLAGAVMWVTGGLAYLVAAVVLFGRWLAAGPARRHTSPAPVVVAGEADGAGPWIATRRASGGGS